MKIKALIMVSCDEARKEYLRQAFGDRYEFTFDWEDDVEVIIGQPEEDEILAAKKLKWIQLTWAGADKYANMTSFPRKIKVTNASGAFGKIISEFAVGGIIAVYRSFAQYMENQKHRMWKRIDSADTIYGKKALILGTGDIGQNVAMRLKAFGAETVGVRRRVTEVVPAHFGQVYGMEELDRLLSEADIVVGCLPKTGGTKGLLNGDRLRLMKKSAVLVNVGRGNLINSHELAEVLREGHLKGAILDVLDVEPLPKNSPLWDAPNVFITPHISGPSFGGNEDVEEIIWNICCENLKRYAKEEVLINLVDLKTGY